LNIELGRHSRPYRTMTDPKPAPPAGRGLSTFLWVSGGALWLLVGVLLVGLYVRGPKTAGAGEGNVVLVQAGTPAAAPAAIWDPKGVADFSFTDQSGKAVTKQDLLGQPWVVGFVFTRCAGPCPRVTGQMRKLQDQTKGEKLRLVTMTVDPDYDTPEILTRYADAFKADTSRWSFLTGDKAKLYDYIVKNFKMPVEETTGPDRKPGYEVIHTTNLLLVDAKGVVRGKYNALAPEEMEKLRRDVKKLEG
jgi:cytochrome oxidase Cu insertion factor (SCO1/SenC/PrrC family)